MYGVAGKAQKYVVSKQLQKSGISIGANIWEAQNSESKLDLCTSLKLRQRKRMKQNIDSCYVNIRRVIILTINCRIE
ncbi:MAG: four helix bundle protein [Tannerella sp.]|nr:four helix bundle protein [Tannerella sp.]